MDESVSDGTLCRHLQSWKKHAEESLKEWRINRAAWVAAVMTSSDEVNAKAKIGRAELPAESPASTVSLPGVNLRSAAAAVATSSPETIASKDGAKRAAAIRNARNPPATLLAEAMLSSYASGYGKTAALAIQAASLLFALGIAVAYMAAVSADCCSKVRAELGCNEQSGTGCGFELDVSTALGTRSTTYSSSTCRDLLSSPEWDSEVTANGGANESAVCSPLDDQSAALIGGGIAVCIMFLVKVLTALLFNWLGGSRLTPGWRSYNREGPGALRRGVKIYPAEFATLITPDGSPTAGVDVPIDKGTCDQHVYNVYNKAANAAWISIAARAVVAASLMIVGIVLSVISSFGYYLTISNDYDVSPMVAFGLIVGIDILVEALLFVMRYAIAAAGAARKTNPGRVAYLAWYEDYADLSSLAGVQEQYAKDMCHNVR